MYEVILYSAIFVFLVFKSQLFPILSSHPVISCNFLDSTFCHLTSSPVIRYIFLPSPPAISRSLLSSAISSYHLLQPYHVLSCHLLYLPTISSSHLKSSPVIRYIFLPSHVLSGLCIGFFHRSQFKTDYKLY